MLRLSLLSAATYGRLGEPRAPGSNHGTAFATAFNGADIDKAKQWKWTFVRTARRVEGARVVRVWDPHREWAERLAEVCGIERVCDTPEEACEGVDAVMVIDDGSGEQWKHALHPLDKGVPVFCDKPLAMTGREAQAVAKRARAKGAPLMSASALRFLPDVVKLREELPQLGNVHLATVACANELIYYGIHALSMAYAVLGGGAVSCLNVGLPGLNEVRIRFANHRDVLLLVGEREWMQAGFQINLYGQKGWRSVMPDRATIYSWMLEEFVRFARTRQEPYPIEQEVELIAALEAGKRSLAEKREVTIAEVLG